MADQAPPEDVQNSNTGSPAGGDTASAGETPTFPNRLRVHALAKIIGVTSKQVLAKLSELGIEARSAQSSLGRMYFKGLGIPQDFVNSHKWYNLAASNAPDEELGIYAPQDYAENRERVAKLMTPAQIAEAQQLAREWQAAFEARQE